MALLGAVTDAQRATVEGMLDRFTELTRVRADFAHDTTKANVIALFVKDPEFEVNREYVPCFARIRSLLGTISRVTIEISVAQPEEIDSCVAHEFLHAFGLRYHSGLVRSVLSPAHDETVPSPWDELALQVLYDERLEVNNSRELARPMIPQIVSELLADPRYGSGH